MSVRYRNMFITIHNKEGPTKEQVVERIRTLDVQHFVVAQEYGKSEETPHIQAVMKFSRKIAMTKIKQALQVQQTHVERTISYKDAVEYCKKEDENYIEEGEYEEGGQSKKDHWTNIKEMLKNGYTKQDIAEEYPKEYATCYKGIEELKNVLQPNIVKSKQGYTIDKCKWERIDFSDNKTIILHGPSGKGKTPYAIASLKNPLYVRHKDTLKQFTPGIHDGIVCDDMTFYHMGREPILSFIENEREAQIDVKNSCVCLPAQTKKIITTNMESPFTKELAYVLKDENEEMNEEIPDIPDGLYDDPAIRKRTRYIKVEEDLFK